MNTSKYIKDIIKAEEILSQYPHSDSYDKEQKKCLYNAYNIPVTRFNLDEDGIHKFNEILKLIKSLDCRPIKRTPSGGIAKGGLNNTSVHWDYRYSAICAEITYLGFSGEWRFQCRTEAQKTKGGRPIYGSTALKMFKEMCAERGINLDDYAVDNGMEIKKAWKESTPTIYKKYIFPTALGLVGKELDNVHHIDLCSGFQSGLARAFPEFYDICKELYDRRKEDNTGIKAVQVESIGAMWSDQRKAKYIKLAKGAIEENNRLLFSIIDRLLKAGRKPLLINTDGVWYQGEVYHDDTEFKDLCGWQNDHINCKFRMKNNVTYEYIENGKFTAVMSGTSYLDRVKSRDKWEWGDIFKTDIITYYIDDEGIKNHKGDLV